LAVSQLKTPSQLQKLTALSSGSSDSDQDGGTELMSCPKQVKTKVLKVDVKHRLQFKYKLPIE